VAPQASWLINGVIEVHDDNDERGGGVTDGAVAGLEKGERRSSPSSGPRSSSASLRRLLALFAGGVFTSGGCLCRLGQRHPMKAAADNPDCRLQ
jgi:hypothetical protein